MFSSEKELETSLYEYMVKNKINPMNNRGVLSVLRQPNLGDSGIADLITYEIDSYGKEFINVIELKNTKFQACNISQVTRYMAAVKGALRFKDVFAVPVECESTFPTVNMTMYPAAEITGSILVIGQDELDTYALGIDGLLFLTSVTVYSLIIDDLQLRFVALSDGMPCIGASENLQPVFASLNSGGE